MTALAPRSLAALISERTGIVRSVTAAPVPEHFPADYIILASRLADSLQFSPWASDSAGAGYSFGDHAAALAAAVGEAVERYCGNLVSADLFLACHAELRHAGETALDPHGLVLFSAEQYQQPGFPWRPFTSHSVTHWARGESMIDRSRALVPACVVWPSYALGTGHGRPLAPVLQAGLATGRDRQHAETGALLEVLERDAMTLAWHGRAGVREVEVDAELADLATGPTHQLHTRFIEFTSPFGIPVLGALVRDLSTGYLALGTGCRSDPRDAAVKALAEGLQLSLLLADYDDPDGSFAAAARHPGSPLRPWRADRSYLSAYRHDLSDVRDYGCHLQLALDPRYQTRFDAELDDAIGGNRVTLGDIPRGDLCDVLDGLTAHGLEPLAVDLTTDDVRAAGLHVTRVLVPGLICNSAAGFPLLGGTRLDRALNGRPRRTLPLPH